ncbi:MAG: hypothetical protein PHQ59_00710 [Candidatus Daviesbacteria bacterium]|nr:hypothetical protein [Candidatus Daviesbacteria bacterium]
MLKTAKIIGLNSDTDAAIALVSYQPEQNFYLFIIISSSLDDAFTRTRQALSDAESSFFASSLNVTDRVLETFQGIKDSLKDSLELNILISATQEEPTDTFFYLLGQCGNLEAFLVRDGKRTDLCELSEGQVISGIIKEGDRIMMCTKTLDKILQDNLTTLETVEIENLEDEIASKLPEAENYPVAAIVVERERSIPKEEGIIEESRPVAPVLAAENGAKTKALLRSLGRRLKRTFSNLIPRSKRGFAVIGVVLLVIVIISAVRGFQNQKSSENSKAINAYLQTATDEFNKAQALKDSDTAEAVTSLNNSRTALEQLFKLDPGNTQAKDLKNRLDASFPEISKTNDVTDFPIWLDLNLIKKDFTARSLSLSSGNLLLLDNKNNALVKINLSSKSQETLAGADKIGNARLASINGNVAFAFSQDKGILRVDSADKKVTAAVKSDSGWGQIADLFAFGGNIYLLDKGSISSSSGQVWKYLPTEAGYSDKREYLTSKVDLKNSIKMQIDSSVWILKNKVEIIKFTQGIADFFSYANLDKPIKEVSGFFVSSDTENLYVLDKGNNRLVVMDKKGNYLSQYTSPKFATFIDFVVDETKKQVFLLDGSKIFSMDLK